MKRYREWSPTQFDPKGIVLNEQGKWFVAPVIQTRDSGCLELSNFKIALEMLGGESNDVEVHRFGHWGPGWFEIIIVNPESDKLSIAEKIESSLADYPILDENDFSSLEWESASSYWESLSIGERVELCQRYNCNVFKARHNTIPDDDNGSLFESLTN